MDTIQESGHPRPAMSTRLDPVRIAMTLVTGFCLVARADATQAPTLAGIRAGVDEQLQRAIEVVSR